MSYCFEALEYLFLRVHLHDSDIRVHLHDSDIRVHLHDSDMYFVNMGQYGYFCMTLNINISH